MSSSIFSIMAQSNTSSDWDWFLIFLLFIVILVVALIVQAIFSKEEADEFGAHEEDEHHEAEANPEPEPEAEAEPEPAPEVVPETETLPEPDNLEKLQDELDGGREQ